MDSLSFVTHPQTISRSNTRAPLMIPHSTASTRGPSAEAVEKKKKLTKEKKTTTMTYFVTQQLKTDN